MKTTFLKIATLVIASVFGLGLLSYASPTYAATDVCNTNASNEIKEAAGCFKNTNNALPDIITGILNAIIAVSGLVAVIFVVIGGINYMTSAGDTQKLEKAKKTILYAVIGMAIAVLSFAAVNFVIVKIIGRQPGNQTPTQQNNQTNNSLNSANTSKEEEK